jgi:diaminopimelate epimerase
MDLECTIYDPTKNITLLVSTPVPRQQQSAVAAALIRRKPEVEQVGFLEPAASPSARLHLQMMGGEFCGNACMAAAAYLSDQEQLTPGQSAIYPLEVSGAEGLITCRLERRIHRCRVNVAMPLPQRIGTAQLPLRGRVFSVPAVWFPGIVHCIVPEHFLTRGQAEEAIRPLCKSLGAEACGILLFSESTSTFTPLVYVASTDTAVWESGCGSGTAALGAYLALRRGTDTSTPLHQPGGLITSAAEVCGKHVTGLVIIGKVRHMESCTIHLDEDAL